MSSNNNINNNNSTSQRRQSRFSNDPNCSICRIVDGEPVIFGKTLYVTNDIEMDYSDKKSQSVFYQKNPGWHSLNQADGAILNRLLLPLNMSFEIFQAFREIDKENENKLWKLFEIGTSNTNINTNTNDKEQGP